MVPLARPLIIASDNPFPLCETTLKPVKFVNSGLKYVV